MMSILSFKTNYPLDDLIQCPLDSQAVPFQCSLSPSESALVICDLDEEPARLDAEVFDGLDFGHFQSRQCFFFINSMKLERVTGKNNKFEEKKIEEELGQL
jgi:hypothetical protein